MRLAITGGAGFIGSCLAAELDVENDITILDDLSTGSLENMARFNGKENIIFIRGSILDAERLQKAFNGIDIVFHLAAVSGVPRSIEEPLLTNAVNITGTLNVLVAARDNKVKKVIFASSAAVYGDRGTPLKSEDMTPDPQSPYALSKLVGEDYCRLFQRLYGLPAVSLRYFNVYGPKQNPDSSYAAVIPAFTERVGDGKPPVIFGDGGQTRDFVYVNDVVRATILAAESDATGVFNIGSGCPTTINGLAEAIATIMGKKAKPLYREPRAGDIEHSLADISNARAIGYKPRYNLNEGLRETLY